MKYLPFFFIVVFIGCSSSPSSHNQELDAPVVSTDPKSPSSTLSQEDPPPQEESVKKTLSVMENAAKEMEEVVELIEAVKDTTVHMDNQPEQAFQKIEKFFSPIYFQYNQNTFWFLTKEGSKVGTFEAGGKVEKCTYGYFTSYKTLVSFQQGESIRTEFYVDVKTGELMVHRYKKNQLDKNKTYTLAGH